MTGILLGKELRKRTPQEKITIIQQAMEPGMTLSHVACLHGIQPSLLFKWKKQYLKGSLTAVASGEEVVPASDLAAALKQVRELQRLLGKKTMEVEILKEAVEYGQARKWIANAPLPEKPVQWLTDNGSAYTAHDTRKFAIELNLDACTTAVSSPQSNGMAERFVKTMKEDYIAFMPKPNVRTALQNLAAAFNHYNENHPHSALGYHSPREYRRRASLT
ncbi:integrase core domain-containing protein [Salmonella enterica]